MTNPEDKSSNALVALPANLSDVLSRVRVDLRGVLGEDGRVALDQAAENCASCEVAGNCDEWIAANEEGEGHPVPEFCVNAELLRTNEPPKVA